MNNLIVCALLIISVILCVLPRKTHCEIFNKFTDMKCPPHICIVTAGLVLFGITIILAQREYISSIYTVIKDSTQVAGAMATRVTAIGRKAISKLPNTENVVNRVEHFIDAMDKL